MNPITGWLRNIFLSALVAIVPGGTALAQDIVLGASIQLTGPVANTGRYYQDAYHIAVDKINAAGGVKIGGQSHKLALKIYDNLNVRGSPRFDGTFYESRHCVQ